MGIRKAVRFPESRGFIAAPMAAWGNSFDLLIQGPKAFSVEGPYAVVDICGPLSQKPNFLCQTDDYESITCRVAAALESDCSSVVLRIESPGGDFSGALETAECLRTMGVKAGKKIIAYTDTRALSAGYILALAASEIVVTPSAFVGSIGVWAPLVDETAADKAKGLNIKIVPSGSKKAARNPHMPMTEETVKDLQGEVDAMALMFFEAVKTSRGISLSIIEGFQGGEMFGEAAVKARLADRVVLNWGAFLTGAQAANSTGKTMPKPYMKALQAAAEEGDEDAKKALKALAKSEFPEKDEDEEKAKKAKAEEDDKKKAAADEEDKKKAKAEDEKKKDEMAKAMASGNEALVALTKRLHQIEADAATAQAAALEGAERVSLLASRPDFSDTVRQTLAASPLPVVRDACKNWPRITHGAPGAGAMATGTAGARDEATGLDAEQNAAIQAMGSEGGPRGIKSADRGRGLEFGFMSPADVAAKLAKMGGG